MLGIPGSASSLDEFLTNLDHVPSLYFIFSLYRIRLLNVPVKAMSTWENRLNYSRINCLMKNIRKASSVECFSKGNCVPEAIQNFGNKLF